MTVKGARILGISNIANIPSCGPVYKKAGETYIRLNNLGTMFFPETLGPILLYMNTEM